jgi:hypothetical protein
MTLFSLLDNIKLNMTRAPYTVSPVEGIPGVYFGLDNDEKPCLFIETSQMQSTPSIITSQIKVEFFKKYRLSVPNQPEREGTYHGVLCLSKDPVDKQTFIAVLESMLEGLNGNLTVESLTSIFHSLVNLFNTAPDPDLTLAQRGLWAELFFMQQNRGFLFWAPFWHSEPNRLFDFSSRNFRTEVKCTIKPERIHEFSHHQLVSMSNDIIVVASILLREDDSGTSLAELINAARTELRGTIHYVKLERAIRSARMNDPDVEGPKFDALHAGQNIAWFRSTDVPRFPSQEPTGVTGTHYRSDLTQALRMTLEEINDWISNLIASEI